MSTLSLGLRLVVILPTLLFLVFQLLHYALRTRLKKELTLQEVPQFKSVFVRLADLSSREFRSEFFVDSVALSIANGLILVFELVRIEYGMVLLVTRVVVAVAGLVAAQVGSSSTEFLSAIMILFPISELTYFVFFGMSFYLLGFSVQPRQVLFLPSIIFGLLVVVFSLRIRRRRLSRSPGWSQEA